LSELLFKCSSICQNVKRYTVYFGSDIIYSIFMIFMCNIVYAAILSRRMY